MEYVFVSFPECVILESGMVRLYLPEDLLIYVICTNICRIDCGSLILLDLCVRPGKSMMSVYKSCTITDLKLFIIFLFFGLVMSCLYPGHIFKVLRLITISLNLQSPSTLVGMYRQRMLPSAYLYLLRNDYFKFYKITVYDLMCIVSISWEELITENNAYSVFY